MSRLSRLNPQFQPAFDGRELAKNLIQVLVERHHVPLLQVYLFGSAAEGKNTIHSDLDLLVVLPDDYDTKLFYKIVYQPFFSPVAVDWILTKNSDFQKNKDIGGISFVATQTGIEMLNDSK